MKPLGYFRALEKLLAAMRDSQLLAVEDDKLQATLNTAADAVDQAWSDLTKDDKLMVYNMAKHLTDNIRPAAPKEPESSVILLN